MTGSALKSRIQDAPAGAVPLPEPPDNSLISSRSIQPSTSHTTAARTNRDPGLSNDRTGWFRFGIPELDALTGGIPRGAITEVLGPAGSGRAALMLTALAQVTTKRELCALVDTDMLDVASAAASGVDLEKLLWVRCPEVVDDA